MKSTHRFLAFLCGAVLIMQCATACVAAPPTSSPAPVLRPITVEDVQIQIGVGSPIPVDVFVSGSWPDLCAQLAEVTQQVDGFQIEIALLATAAQPACPPDYLGVPFRIAIPINGVELPPGKYGVVVNGISAAFDWPTPQ